MKLADNPNLRIVFVDKIHSQFIMNLLEEAQQRNGFKTYLEVQNLPHGKDILRARPKVCSPGVDDVHFRLPGIMDMCIEAWMTLVGGEGLWAKGTKQYVIPN